MERFREGAVSFLAENKQTRGSEAFFNPDREFDRNLNVLLIKAIGRSGLDGLDLMSASGVRGLRLAVETEGFKTMALNDLNTYSVLKKNVESNSDLIKSEVSVSSFNAAETYKFGKVFDYIDIDPFGSPVTYALYAMNSIKLGGILALTATDTAALYGRAAKACALKYRSVSCKTSYYNELGLRILLKRIDEIAGIYKKSIEPMIFDVRRHYIRTYIKIGRIKSSTEIDTIYQCPECPNRSMQEEFMCSNCGAEMNRLGPLWTGRLFDRDLVLKMYELSSGLKEKEYLSALKEEEDMISYYTTTEIAKYLKQPEKKNGLLGSKTVLNSKGFRTKMAFKELVGLYSKL
ncbi:MAG: hypothetical protein M1433_00545 [Candidatus Parvarchaeota archaeon]|nr:hypothetical protein [Candidatus Parvarchaeota archaeon]